MCEQKNLIDFTENKDEVKLGTFVSTTTDKLIVTSALLVTDKKDINAILDKRLEISSIIEQKIAEVLRFGIESKSQKTEDSVGCVSKMTMTFPIEKNEILQVIQAANVCRKLHIAALNYATSHVAFMNDIDEAVKIINEEVYG